MEATRFTGFFTVLAGAWWHTPAIIALGLAVIAYGWAAGLLPLTTSGSRPPEITAIPHKQPASLEAPEPAFGDDLMVLTAETGRTGTPQVGHPEPVVRCLRTSGTSSTENPTGPQRSWHSLTLLHNGPSSNVTEPRRTTTSTAGTVRSRRQCHRSGVGVGIVRMLNEPERRMNLTIRRCRGAGVWLGFLSGVESSATSQPELHAEMLATSMVRVATIRKSRAAEITDRPLHHRLFGEPADMIGLRSSAVIYQDDPDRGVTTWIDLLG